MWLHPPGVVPSRPGEAGQRGGLERVAQAAGAKGPTNLHEVYYGRMAESRGLGGASGSD